MVQASPEDLLAWRALVQILVQQERAEEALARLEDALDADDPPVGLYPLAAQVRAALRPRGSRPWRCCTPSSPRSESAAAYLPLVNFHSARNDAEATTAVLEGGHRALPRRARAAPAPRRSAARCRSASTTPVPSSATSATPPSTGTPRSTTCGRGSSWPTVTPRVRADRLRKLAPRLDRAATQFWLGQALEVTGDLEGARRRYGLAQQRDPSWLAPIAALLGLDQRRGDWRSAAGHARLLVARAPERLEGWTAVVESLANLGEGEAAEQVARGSLERFPERPEAHLLLAKAFRRQPAHPAPAADYPARRRLSGAGTGRGGRGPRPGAERAERYPSGRAGRTLRRPALVPCQGPSAAALSRSRAGRRSQ